jgi:HEAT repeat protein
MKTVVQVLAALCFSAGMLHGGDRSNPALAEGHTPAKKPVSAAIPQQRQGRIDATGAARENLQAPPEDVARLIDQLKDSSPLVRAHAAYALGKLGEAAKPAVEALVSLVADPDPAVRREASRAVLNIRPGPAVTVPLAKKLLADADPAVRMRFLNTLADLGKEAVPGLIEALKDDDVAQYACVVLTVIGPDAAEASPALISRFQAEKRPEVRQQIIMALGAIRSAEAVPALTSVLEDPERADRVPAAFALGQIGPPAKAAKAALTECLQDSDPVLKAVSAWALVKIAPDDQALKDRCVALLSESLLSKNPLARRAALRALADVRPGPQRVLPILKRVLEGPDRAAAAEALDVLAEIGEPAVPALIEALKLPEYRAMVASILGRIGPSAKDAVPALVEVVKTDENSDSRREALLALGGIGPASEAAVPAATAALGDSDERVVLAACYALTKIGPAAKEAIPALKKLADDKDETVREYAATARKAID